MRSIVIGPSVISLNGHRIDVDIFTGETKFQLYYQSENARLQPCSEAFLSVTLLPAMKLRYDQIEIEGEASKRFIQGQEEIQAVFREWKPNYGEVAIRHSGLKQEIPEKRKNGVFFSSGVDSYHSLLSHLDEVDALIHLDGFDIPLTEVKTRARMQENLKVIGERLGKKIIIVETNARDYMERYLTWTLGHGGAIASVGHLLSQEFSRFLIASGGNPRSGRPFGVHPKLDPNWSSDGVEFIHDSYFIDRIEKIRTISKYDTVLDTLRVCLRFPEYGLNCGECEKCLRTMVYLQVTGDYKRYRVFEKPLDLKLLAKYKRISGPERDLLYPALEQLEKQNTYPETVSVLKDILYPPDWKKKLILNGRKIRKRFSRAFGR